MTAFKRLGIGKWAGKGPNRRWLQSEVARRTSQQASTLV